MEPFLLSTWPGKPKQEKYVRGNLRRNSREFGPICTKYIRDFMTQLHAGQSTVSDKDELSKLLKGEETLSLSLSLCLSIYVLSTWPACRWFLFSTDANICVRLTNTLTILVAITRTAT